MRFLQRKKKGAHFRSEVTIQDFSPRSAARKLLDICFEREAHMSPQEEEDSRATWQSSNMNWDQSFDAYEMPPLQEDQEQLQPDSKLYAQVEEDEERANPSPLSWEGLQQIGRQFSFVIVPLLFALVICVITLPFTPPETPTRHLS